MDASLAEYRARIGLYAGCTGRIRSQPTSSSVNKQGLSLRLLPSLLLCGLLLLMSGVEPNPGPSFQCSICCKLLKTTKSYFEHQSQHSTGKIPCPISSCHSLFSTLGSLQSHISIYHKTKDSETNLACPVPGCLVSFPQNNFSHLGEHLKLGQTFRCPFQGCDALHKSKANFHAHVNRNHIKSASVNVPTQPFPREAQNVPTTSSSHPEPPQVSVSSNPWPPYEVKKEILRFYMELEGIKVLPSTHVQDISEEIALLSEMSHHCLKTKLLSEMQKWGIQEDCINNIIASTFSSDPVFNVHHKHHDREAVTSTYLRKELMHTYYPYVSAVEIPLGPDAAGKPRLAHYVPLRCTLETLLKNEKVAKEVMKSLDAMSRTEEPEEIQDRVFQDYIDGSAFKEHQKQHEDGKCLQLVFFQDAFEFSPFGPAKGLYKSIGMFYYLGNLPPEYRSKVDQIQLALLLQEKHIKLSEAEVLQGVNGFQKGMDLLLKDLDELRANGLLLNGVRYPVCFLFFTGDNLGSHQIGSFVQSFTAKNCCRYCSISTAQFKQQPHKCENLRTPEEYDRFVAIAKAKFEEAKKAAIKTQERRREIAKTTGAVVKGGLVSKNALKTLSRINHLGVKPVPSVLNQIPGFHVAAPGLPPCLAHDLFEGVVNLVLAKIFQHWIETKQWFSLETLNKRIKRFEYKGKDKADSPNAIHSYDGVKGHACETWTLLRLLPFIIGDLIKDKQDKFWLLYLKLKEVCEYVCAPKISFKQVMFLNVIIQEYLCEVKELLPSCLTPKHHYLCHYPNLILIFGPLIRLFTMRFESAHVFFKTVGKACKNFRNITHTLANKYQYRFAYLHRDGVLPEDVLFDSSHPLSLDSVPADLHSIVVPRLASNQISVKSVVIKGVNYKINQWFVVDKANENDLCVGQIRMIIYDSDVNFVLSLHCAENTYLGYYKINSSVQSTCTKTLADLPDYYPLPSYLVNGQNCLSLKHSVISM